MAGETAVIAPTEVKKGPIASIVDLSLENYKWGKDLVAANKTLGPRVAPIVSFAEEKAKTVLKKSPIAIDDVVTAIDTRVEKAVNYGQETIQTVRETPGKWKNGTLLYVHEKLQSLKSEPEAAAAEQNGESIGLQTVALEAKSVTAEKLNQLLDASQGYLQQYLPPTTEEGEEEQLALQGPKDEIRPVATRAFKLSKVAAKRVQERALSKVGNLKRRTTNVVHVDLVKYSEWLDKQKNFAKDTVYVSLEKVDTRLVKPTKERIDYFTMPFQNRVVHVWTVVGDQYNEKVVKPRDQIIQMFREELALQQELAKQKNGEEHMTIQAGLAAVVAAARARLSKEWEVRVSPTLARFMGRTNEYEEGEEEEEKSFGDADEGEEQEQEQEQEEESE